MKDRYSILFYPNNWKIRSVLAVSCGLFLFLSVYRYSFAAEVVPAVGNKENDGTQEVVFLLRSDEPLNALEGSIIVPTGGTIKKISNAGSIVTFWIKDPALRDGKVTFAGIIPGGFTGEGILFHVVVEGNAAGFRIDPDSVQLLKNDGAGTAASIQLPEAIPLPRKYAENPPSSDHNPPDDFTPLISRHPDLFDGRPFITFATRDGGSGVRSYEIAQSDRKVTEDDKSLQWQSVDPSTPLPLGMNTSYVYVRVLDGSGNMRLVVVPVSAAVPSGDGGAFNIILGGSIIGVLVIGLGAVLWRRYRHGI